MYSEQVISFNYCIFYFDDYYYFLIEAIGTISPKQVRIVAGGSAQIKFYTLLPYEKCEVTTSKNNHLVYDKKIPNDTVSL